MKRWWTKSAGRALARPALARGLSSWAGGSVQGDWPRGYEAQVRDGFVGNAVAQRAVRMVAEGVGAAPLSVSDDAVAKLIGARSAGQPLLETVALHLLLHGNAFVQILRQPDALASELFALRPERVTIEADARGWPAAFAYRTGPTQGGDALVRLAVEDVIHVKTLHPLDDHYGLGCLGAAAGPIAIHNAATRWNKALLDNAAPRQPSP